MKTGSITIMPFALAADRRDTPGDVLDLIATVRFWRARMVEFTLLASALALVAIGLGFAIACQI